MNIKEPTAARRRIFLEVFDLDGQPKTGLVYTNAGSTHGFQVSKNGAAFVDGTGAVTEVGGGTYYYTADAAELDTIGSFTVKLGAQSNVSQQSNAIIDITIPSGLHNIPNSMLDKFVYNGNKMATSSRLRVFADATALAAAVAGHADGTDGEIERYTVAGVDAGFGLPSSVTYTRVFP